MSIWTAPKGWREHGADASWLYATALLRELTNSGHFTGLVLHTDARGEAWARELGLSFDAVHRTLDALDASLAPIWASGKLATYAAQRQPFVHFDGDVFLKSPLPAHALAARYLFERSEPFAACQCRGSKVTSAFHGWQLPENWQRAMEGCLRSAWGCGIAGGLDWQGFAEAAAVSLDVARKNVARLGPDPRAGAGTTAGEPGGWASLFVEQWGIPRGLDLWHVGTLLPEIAMAVDAASSNYSHSGPEKRDPDRQRAVYLALQRRFPALSERAGAPPPPKAKPALAPA